MAAQSTLSILIVPWPESPPPPRATNPDPLASPVGGGGAADVSDAAGDAAGRGPPADAVVGGVGAALGPAPAADAAASTVSAAIDIAAAEILLVASVVRRSIGHSTFWPFAPNGSVGSLRKKLDQWDKREG